jgi:thiol-disulfide isomerase/thioredoxin
MHARRYALTGGVLLSLTILATGCTAPPESLAGAWDATVVVDGVEVPFTLDIVEDASGVRVAFVNGEDRLGSTAATVEGGRLSAAFDHYATKLEATIDNGRLEGRYDRGPRGAYPFRATRATPPPAPEGQVPSIAGLWHIGVQSNKGETAWRLIVQQSGPQATAAILRVDGDTGALTGRYTDGRFVLGHFSGARPLLLEISVAQDGTLDILRNKKDRLVAVRAESAPDLKPTDPSRHSTPVNPAEPFRFSFPDLDGKIVANSDSRYQGKVVIVSITGTWCPNCHDEAPFLTEMYRQYRSVGLEIVALSFEEAAQLADPWRARAYVEQYEIEYPLLIAGIPDDLNEKVPQIANLNAFPTTIYLGRDGRVRAVHAGFPSRASGKFHEEAKEEIRGIVETLLGEEGPDEHLH